MKTIFYILLPLLLSLQAIAQQSDAATSAKSATALDVTDYAKVQTVQLSAKEKPAFQNQANTKLKRFVTLLNMMANPKTAKDDYTLAEKELRGMLGGAAPITIVPDKYKGYTFTVADGVAFGNAASADAIELKGKNAAGATVKLTMTCWVADVQKTFGTTTRQVKQVQFYNLLWK